MKPEETMLHSNLEAALGVLVAALAGVVEVDVEEAGEEVGEEEPVPVRDGDGEVDEGEELEALLKI